MVLDFLFVTRVLKVSDLGSHLINHTIKILKGFGLQIALQNWFADCIAPKCLYSELK